MTGSRRSLPGSRAGQSRAEPRRRGTRAGQKPAGHSILGWPLSPGTARNFPRGKKTPTDKRAQTAAPGREVPRESGSGRNCTWEGRRGAGGGGGRRENKHDEMRLKTQLVAWSLQQQPRSSALTWGEPGLPAAAARPGRCPLPHRYGSGARRGGPGRGGAAPAAPAPGRVRSARPAASRRGSGAARSLQGACLPSTSGGTNGRAAMVTFRSLKISWMVPRPASPSLVPYAPLTSAVCAAHWPNSPLVPRLHFCPKPGQLFGLLLFVKLNSRTIFYALSEQSSCTTRKIL